MTIARRTRRWLDRLSRVTARVEDSLLVLIVTTLIVIAALQIFLRNFLNIGLVWGDPLLRPLVLWVGMLGAMVASRTENHIAIDLLSRFLSRRWKVLARILTDLFTVIVCALMSYYSLVFVRYEYQDGTPLVGNVPAWAAEAILPVGFALIGLRYLFAILRVTLSHTDMVSVKEPGP